MHLFIVQRTILWHIDTGLLTQEAGSVWGQASAGSVTVNTCYDLSVSQNWSQLYHLVALDLSMNFCLKVVIVMLYWD